MSSSVTGAWSGKLQLVKGLTSRARPAAEPLALAGLVALSAGWLTHLGALPARLPPLPGPLGVGLAWAGLFGVLGLVYCARARPDRRPPRLLLRRVGAAVLLALLSTELCRRLATTLVTEATWDQLFYLKRLVAPAFVAFWCAVLLRTETRSLARAARVTPILAPLVCLAVLLASAAVLVSCGDLAFEWGGRSAIGIRLKADIISREAWTGNVLIVFSAYAFVFALARRLEAALLLVSPLYAMLGLVTLAKIRYMHAAVQPLDLLRLPELVPLLPSFVGTGVLAAVIGALALWAAALVQVGRTRPCVISPVGRWSTAALALAGLLMFPVAYFQASPTPHDVRDSLSPADGLLSRFQVRGRELKEMARVRGFLIAFIAELPAAFVSVPPDYSASRVASVLGRYCPPRPRSEPAPRKVNLIVYLVESFVDPETFGLRYTADPIPTVRALGKSHVGGYGIVPEEFGGSANTEFEVLTGMATAFLPEGGVAYRLYLKHPIPSLPNTLRDLGYATTAVQADPKHYYERERAYRLLGFDRVVWLGDTRGVERAPRGLWPSDRAVVEAVIEASRVASPFFVFAFPSSTHAPYSTGTYRTSDLHVVGAPAKDAGGELQEYINAVRVADREIGTLVEYFRRQPDPTMIAVLGDHLPPLPEGALRTFFMQESGISQMERARRRRRVPLIVWANFPLLHEAPELGSYAIPSYLLEKMGLAAPGFLAVSDAVRRTVPVLSGPPGGAGGTWSWDSLPSELHSLAEDYRLLQYDLLLGRRHALRGSAAGACRPATRRE